MANLYVRVRPKSGSTTFMRCALLHTLLWVFHQGLDTATAEALKNEQMLETSEKKPDDFDSQEAEQAAAEAENAIETHGDAALIGSAILPSVITIAGDVEMQLGQLVQGAFNSSKLSVAGWNGLPQEEREKILQGTLDDLQGIVEGDAKAAEAATNAAQANQAMIDGLNSQVSSLTSERDTARESLSAVTSERDGLNTTVSTLQSQVTSLQAELKTAQAGMPATKSTAKKA